MSKYTQSYTPAPIKRVTVSNWMNTALIGLVLAAASITVVNQVINIF